MVYASVSNESAVRKPLFPTVPNGQQQAAVYARVSTTDQADKGYSLPTQIEACLALARQHGYAVPETHVFVDDYTGTSLNRPQFKRLRDLVQQRLVQAVIVQDLDRLSRKLAHQLLLSEEFEEAGVPLHIVTMPATDKSPESHLFATMKGAFAEYERLKILEKTERGRRGRVQAGFVPTGRVPFGYRYVKHATKGAHYEIDPDEAALVQRIFGMYVEAGCSQDAIAQQLTRDMVPAPGERRPGVTRTLTRSIWHPSAVADILRNETYIGVMYYGKKQRVAGKQNPDKKTRWRTVPASEWIAIAVPPIIDAATFQSAQRLRTQNQRDSRRNRKYEYLLVGGRLRCGQCGRAMTGEINGHSRARYKCGRKPYQDMPGTHVRRSVLVSEVERPVWAAVVRALKNPKLIAQEAERQRDGTSTQQDALARERQQYEKQLAACAKDLKRWEAAYVGEVIDLEDFKAKKAEVDARRASVEQELARLDEQAHVLQQMELETTSLTAYCQRVHAKLTRFDIAEQRVALEALNIRVVWHHDKPPEIKGAIPLDIVSNAGR